MSLQGGVGGGRIWSYNVAYEETFLNRVFDFRSIVFCFQRLPFRF